MKNKMQMFCPIRATNKLVDNINGRVGVPILLYLLGVPGGLVLLIWFFAYRGT